MTAPSYKGLSPASHLASKAARASSRKQNTKPELLLRRALWQAGYRYRKNVATLPGKPDIVFKGTRLAVFIDGDFWHGRDWNERRARLARGHNASYWVAKIERNMTRDCEVDVALRNAGWRVLRVWEGQITQDVKSAVDQVEQHLLWEVSSGDSAAGSGKAPEPKGFQEGRR